MLKIPRSLPSRPGRFHPTEAAKHCGSHWRSLSTLGEQMNPEPLHRILTYPRRPEGPLLQPKCRSVTPQQHGIRVRANRTCRDVPKVPSAPVRQQGSRRERGVPWPSQYQALWVERQGIVSELLESLSAEDIKASCGRQESHTASPTSLRPVPETSQLRTPCVSCPLPFVSSFTRPLFSLFLRRISCRRRPSDGCPMSKVL